VAPPAPHPRTRSQDARPDRHSSSRAMVEAVPLGRLLWITNSAVPLNHCHSLAPMAAVAPPALPRRSTSPYLHQRPRHSLAPTAAGARLAHPRRSANPYAHLNRRPCPRLRGEEAPPAHPHRSANVCLHRSSRRPEGMEAAEPPPPGQTTNLCAPARSLRSEPPGAVAPPTHPFRTVNSYARAHWSHFRLGPTAEVVPLAHPLQIATGPVRPRDCRNAPPPEAGAPRLCRALPAQPDSLPRRSSPRARAAER
jgi:hypothetical protein